MNETTPNGQQGYPGQLGLTDDTSEHNMIAFLIRQFLGDTRTMTVVKVVAVSNSGGVEAVGTVDVQPLVQQMDGVGNLKSHGQVFSLPYFRLQGGANAFIIDPQVGDIGMAVISDRDLSKVKATKAEGGPGSFRRFNFADGVYVGGILNGAPTQYVRFTDGEVEIVATSKVKITAPTIEMTGDIQVSGAITAGHGTADAVSLQTHKHGVGAPAAGTSVPTPGT